MRRNQSLIQHAFGSNESPEREPNLKHEPRKRGDDMPRMMLFVFVIVCMLSLYVTILYHWMPQKYDDPGGNVALQIETHHIAK